jgi:FlaA1/EpsC-like NDP-sugar epimerase
MGSALWRWGRRHSTVVQGMVDAIAWTLSLLIAILLRLDFTWTGVDTVGVAAMIPLAIEAQWLGGYLSGLYRGRWRYGSFDEVAALVRAVIMTTAILFAIGLALDHRAVPLSSVLGAGFGALVLMGGARYVWRLRHERRLRPGAEGTDRLLVLGAGEGGVQVVTAMLRDPSSPYIPVGLLDDDPVKRNLRILGVPVVGTSKSLASAAKRLNVDALLVAIPSAPAPLMREISDEADEIGLPVKVLPPVRDLFGAAVGVEDIRDIDTRDLLGRRQVETDLDSVAGYLTGKRVLVTGAGGSIGSELCRQIVRFEPAQLIMLDRNESALHAVQLSIEGRALLDSNNLVLASIREPDTLRRVFNEHRPDVVFHAAALKHLPLLENFPTEALKTNVMGTLNVLEAAAAAGVERLVNLSTDKAADPASVLGYSKRISERLTAHVGESAGHPYLSVRFGNVLLSSGSVLATFQAQLASGAPLTVTDPDVSRFFMTVEEAVELVIQAGAIGRCGEVLVLDMGEPVRIADVARRLAQPFGGREIVFTGLRPGEKLHEVLFGRGEVDERPVHPLISHVSVPALDPEVVRAIPPGIDGDEMRLALMAVCDEAAEAAR